ncbi:protein shisa-5-like [Mastacembelus armatus]|uniref:Protein shisa-5-like n=1 Tax=Mastacembelus armatus TaxID=205130 RepID=A0A3Q3M6P5_9TELE|nr:protein shisa-5-like [Mastacembelus armatus]
MASGLLSVIVVLALCTLLFTSVSGDNDCKAYRDLSNNYQPPQYCYPTISETLRFCCGTCINRYCCSQSFLRLSEDKQSDCYDGAYNLKLPIILGVGVVLLLIFICCCVCPCCCLYKMCRKPQPVITTTTHTTVVTGTPQQYPQQQTANLEQPHGYQGVPYPPYQPVPVQPGYGTQPMPTLPYQGQPFTPGPPPTYQEATGPAYPPNLMPNSQAAFTPGQPAYPIHPPVHLQPNAPPTNTDYFTQPAYNPDYVAPPPKTG